MALITPITAEEVWEASKLTPQHIGLSDDDEAIALVDSEIIPDVVMEANAEVDRVVSPLDFPFSLDLLTQAYPGEAASQIQERYNYQNGGLHRALLWLALSDLYSRVGLPDPIYEQKAERFKRWGDERMEKVLVDLAHTAGMFGGTSEGHGRAKEFGVFVLKTKKLGHNRRTEFGPVPCRPYYPY